MGTYDGKRVVITGGASGIGLATAKLASDQGAQVMVTGHDGKALQNAREHLGPSAIAIDSDAASLADVDVLAARARSEFGTLDALIVCGGQTRFVPFEKMDEDLYDKLLPVNAKGPYFTVQKLSPLMPQAAVLCS